MCLLTNCLYNSDHFPRSRLPSSPQGFLQSLSALVFQLSWHVTHSLKGCLFMLWCTINFPTAKTASALMWIRDCWTAPDPEVHTLPLPQHLPNRTFALFSSLNFYFAFSPVLFLYSQTSQELLSQVYPLLIISRNHPSSHLFKEGKFKSPQTLVLVSPFQSLPNS